VTREDRLVKFVNDCILNYPAPDWLRREADIALHGWPKETGGAQTPEVAEAMRRAWQENPRG
jgi:hypothetical protein